MPPKKKKKGFSDRKPGTANNTFVLINTKVFLKESGKRMKPYYSQHFQSKSRRTHTHTPLSEKVQ